MILNKLTPREKKIFYVVIGLLGLVLGYHGAWRPMLEKFSLLDEEIFAFQMKLRKAKIYLRQEDEIREEAKKYPNLEKIEAGTDEEETARLLNLIEQTARNSSVSLSDVKPQEVKSDRITRHYAVELNAESSLDALLAFVYALEHSPEFLKIEQVNTAPKEDQAAVLRTFLIVTRTVVK